MQFNNTRKSDVLSKSVSKLKHLQLLIYLRALDVVTFVFLVRNIEIILKKHLKCIEFFLFFIMFMSYGSRFIFITSTNPTDAL